MKYEDPKDNMKKKNQQAKKRRKMIKQKIGGKPK